LFRVDLVIGFELFSLALLLFLCFSGREGLVFASLAGRQQATAPGLCFECVGGSAVLAPAWQAGHQWQQPAAALAAASSRGRPGRPLPGSAAHAASKRWWHARQPLQGALQRRSSRRARVAGQPRHPQALDSCSDPQRAARQRQARGAEAELSAGGSYTPSSSLCGTREQGHEQTCSQQWSRAHCTRECIAGN